MVRQHRMSGHCRIHRLSIADAEDVAPSRRYHYASEISRIPKGGVGTTYGGKPFRRAGVYDAQVLGQVTDHEADADRSREQGAREVIVLRRGGVTG